ncbi:MAG: Nif3-like dinuclear metal center hexameric protein [Prevotellaceae bacterium]|jgi:dinuclear metal center YbgI/SA1388 family protein|nr:Nif3-like dinuclear metal center hexameric protein [Prevotellaceae bacterium]
MTAREVARVVETWAPLSVQETWDNAGFCVGNPQTEVTGVVLCLDSTPSVVEEAVALGANMVISHHPLIFGGIKQLCEQDTVAQTVAYSIKNDLVIYSAHTNADKVATGVSWVMANQLNLQNIKTLSPDNKLSDFDPSCTIGLGAIGDLVTPFEAFPFLQTVKRLFSLSCLRVGPIFVPKIHKVAVCGGSGAPLIPVAIELGADIFLSGDIGYHHFFSTSGKMIVADMGHYESEIGIVHKIAHLLSEKNLNFAVHLSKNSTNPIQYF